MQILKFSRLESDPTNDVLALVEGHVFHVTKTAYWPAIVETGKIVPNQGLRLPTTFGAFYNSFFRNIGCVCVFDYRTPPDEDILDYRSRCNPLQPATPGDGGIVIVILNSSLYSDLIPWTAWKEQADLSQMVVPYVEAGLPGSIPISKIDQAIFLHLREDPGCLTAALRKPARNKGLEA